jgi:predicted DNA-binding transcriptional regulator YafY
LHVIIRTYTFNCQLIIKMKNTRTQFVRVFFLSTFAYLCKYENIGLMSDTKRLPRLTAILTQLQTKRLLTATELAEKFSVSIRTIYRDIKALEEAGVPVLTVDGKGYSLMEGYRIPPVMFTESEANALITAEQLVLKNKDASFVKEYSEAINKIKSVLQNSTKDKANLLSNRIVFRQNTNGNRTSNYLSVLQLALTNFNLAEINYYASDTNETTIRFIEPFALYSTQENWLLIAWCRLRKNYRAFRLDRINKLTILDKHFEPHQLTLEEYFEICRRNSNFSDP